MWNKLLMYGIDPNVLETVFRRLLKSLMDAEIFSS